ncbi:MAG: TonB-dependent receptor [Polaromonas sp.]|nr:TonB-dependent receptor [Polaromonas sp.]
MKKSVSLRGAVLALSVFPWHSLSLAQVLELNPIVVVAARSEQLLSDALVSVSVFTREDIDQSQAPTLVDLLQGEAGFEFGRNGGPGTTTSMFLRGQSSINLVIMIDGVRSPVDQIGSLQILDVPLAQIERIEVLRGNASALYGDAAVGGVISITTRGGKGKPAAYGTLSYGSRNTRELSAGYGGTTGEYSFNINAGRNQSDGFSAMNARQNAAVNPAADAYSSEFAAARVDRKIDAGLSVGLRLAANTSSTFYDSPYDTPADTHQFKKKNSSLNVYMRKALGDDWVSTVDVSSSRLTYEDFKNQTRLASYGLFEGTNDVVRWFNTYQLRSNTLVNFGVDKSRENFSANGAWGYDMQRDGLGYFVGATSTFDKLTLQANVRHDEISVDTRSGGAQSTNDVKNNAALLGLGYQLAQAFKLTVSTSSGFRAPTAYEVSTTPMLKPETYASREAGLVYASGSSYVRAVYFQTNTKDALTPNANYDAYTNVGEVQNKGLELTTRAQWLGNSIKGSWVSQKPFNLTDDKLLDRRARLYGSLDVSRVVGGYELGSKIYASGERSEGARALSGYALVSLYASKKIDKDVTLRLRLDNAFNRDYQLAYGYNTPGRSVMATLQYSPSR